MENLIKLNAAVKSVINFHESALVPFSDLDDQQPRAFREVLILQTGTFKGHTFTRGDLAEAGRNFDADDPPPIQLDHSDSARDTVGHLRAVKVVGDRLLGLAEFVGDEAVSKVSSKVWRKVSVGIYTKPDHRVRELSVTPFPAVPTAAIFKEELENTAETPQEEGGNMEDEIVENTDDSSGVVTEQPPTVEDEQVILSQMDARVAQLEEQLERERSLRRLSENTQAVVGLIEGGHSVPALKDKELEFLSKLPEELMEDYIGLRKELPQVWKPGRLSAVSVEEPGSKEKREDEQLARMKASRPSFSRNGGAK